MSSWTPKRSLRKFCQDAEGNVAIIFALAALTLLVASGVAVDYGTAAKVKTQLQAVADAAVLAALTPAEFQQSPSAAKIAVEDTFAAQAALISGFTYQSSNLNPQVQDTPSVSKTRTVTVSYSAQVKNVFGGFYLKPYTTFTVSSSASITQAPNINFYLLLDNSPSMELPATQSGLNTMGQTGCNLACHESDFRDGEYSNQYPGWGQMDSYTYAENNGITLRIDNVREAAKSLVSTAYADSQNNHANYGMAAYQFNFQFSPLQTLATISGGNESQMISNIGSLIPPLMAENGYLGGNQSYMYPVNQFSYNTVQLGSNSLYNSDAMSDFNLALTNLNQVMPNPGNGTTQPGDTPQEVVLIATDGVDDANLYQSSSCGYYPFSYSNTYGSFTRCIQPMNTAMCNTIKARGIRIAVLYLTYFPMPANGFYNAYVSPFISQVPTNLASCASSPTLFAEVQTGGDITAALTKLFENAVASAPHLTQ